MMGLLVSNQEGGGQGKEVPTTNHPPRNILMMTLGRDDACNQNHIIFQNDVRAFLKMM